MLECNITVTLARCVDGATWTTEIIRNASWFSKAVGAMTDRGLQGSREIHCRIPASSAPEMMPKIGDYIVNGSLPTITSIKNLDGLDFGKITNVADNRRGGKALQHIAVVAS